MPNSRQIFSKIKELTKPCETARYLVNRNPRNLEKLRIAYKPSGYHLEKKGRSFWHKLELNETGRYVTAKVIHYEAGPVLQASTSEWSIKKQLYKTKDTSAYINLARVLAQRCLESGLFEMRCDITVTSDGKVGKFLETLRNGGVVLDEPERFEPHRPWDAHRPEKPWDITE